MRELPVGTITLLFTDIEGSTRLLQQLGDGYAALLADCRSLLRVVFEEYHGYEVDTQGDAFFLAFARARDAVSAAVSAQRALANHAWPGGIAVRVRMGLHTGEPERSLEGYVGLDVHFAARIMSAGHGGQVLLSSTTRDLLADDLPEGLSLHDLGVYRLKDIERPGRLFQLIIPGLPNDFPPLRTVDICPCHLPAQLTPLIGREQEVAAICSMLLREDVRLHTLTGTGGVGKTRLAVQVAEQLCERFTDGAFFVSLAPIRDPELVLPAIAQTLNIREAAGQSLLEGLQEELRHKQMLLILDNLEQIVSAAPQIVDLLAACPKLKVFTTSREVLRVQGEYEFAVPPLALPDPKHLPDLAALSHYEAVELFLKRTQAVTPGFQLTGANAAIIAEICARLDGLPLAIELAAARMKLLSPQALLARLNQRLQLLTSGKRDAPARQQTLRNTIAWSYDLLNAEEQWLFQHLSVFAGGCTLEAVEKVCAACGGNVIQVLDVIASLLDKSLLRRVDQQGEEARFTMLETLREYALELLVASGEAENARCTYALYYLALLEATRSELGGPQGQVWTERLEQEQDNFRAAVEWALSQAESGGDPDLALRMSIAMRPLWNLRGNYSEIRALLERALKGSKGSVAGMRAGALLYTADFAHVQGDIHRAEELGSEGLNLYQALADREGIALSFHLLADIAWTKGDLRAARLLGEDSLALFRELQDKANIAGVLIHFASLATEQAEYERARTLLQESLAINRELESKSGIADALHNLSRVEFFAQGDLARARSLLQESLSLFAELSDKESIAYCTVLAGRIALQQGNIDTARQLLEESLALFRAMRHQHGTTVTLASLARVAIRQGDYSSARDFAGESLSLARKAGDKLNIATGLESLAEALAAQGQLVQATRLWRAAASVRDALPAPLPLIDRAAYEGTLAATRAKLGAPAFDTAWEEGQAMTLEQVLTSS